jgi:integrase
MTEKPPSNPVAPTILFVPFVEANGAEPVAQPVSATDRAALALSTAAQALLAVVESLRANGVPSKTTFEDTLTVAEVAREFLITKARAGRSDRYLRQLRVSLSSFLRGRSSAPISTLTAHDVEKWLFSRDWRARTMRGYLADVRTLFNFAVRRGYLKSSVAATVELPEDESRFEPPGIHTPDEVRKILATARASSLDVLRHLAVRYFAGVRSAEAHRLREENLLLDRGYIEVPALKAKTRRRRLVKIQPNLRAWLELGGELRAMRPERIREVSDASGVEWKKNVTRHSFVSYHLARWQNAGKTALEAGHSEAMLFAHYRELVTEEAAEAFWSILPEK